MFDKLRTRLLHVMRVPHDPQPPTGAPGSVRVFRAGKNLYKLRLLRWGLAQAGAIAGIVFSLGFLTRVEREVDTARREIKPSVAAAPAPATSPAEPAPVPAPATASPTPEVQPGKASPKKAEGRLSPAAKQRARSSLARLVERWPPWIFPVLALLEWIGIALYIVQIPITYALVRLDYELRWYIVTDRSLRIRTGLTTVQESTMSFANVQQVVVTQGPLQRALGISDVRVQSAGGGGGESHDEKGGDSLHTGVFHGVENAHEVRDLILERLRRFRETGLGDPDEPAPVLDGDAVAPPPSSSTSASSPALAAAQELLREAQALRAALS
jgi:hypothetical protein